MYSHTVDIIPATSLVQPTGEYHTRAGSAVRVVTNLSGVVIALYDSNMNIFSNEQKVTVGGFLAIWYGGQITDTPLIIYLDTLATDIALSTTYAFTNGESGNLDEV